MSGYKLPKWDEPVTVIKKEPEKKVVEKVVKNESKNENTEAKIWDGEWMLKPCHMYEEEYKDCKSLRGRFYQYYVHGEQLDCTQWKRDYQNCQKWRKKQDEVAYNDLVESVKKRRLERLKSHVANDTWTRRTKPPEDWNEPLPEWMVKKNEGTFLAAKQKSINADGYDHGYDQYVPSCTIL
ncbi:uncharacterized protein LOC103571624 [Microplitis demolitor]|uniref:uncharacterized protein LOC103571624 n=1 Tax=Microplitis demolitor TaxID=69319 RepID=UPI0004CD61DA|nr:uncharacterized protein LOC103571624 [Microplitis demolitor]